uniref:Piwi n=1 Tax=Anopheles dirus TaxID=7168 RepID=A0A182MXI9_9DIPT
MERDKKSSHKRKYDESTDENGNAKRKLPPIESGECSRSSSSASSSPSSSSFAGRPAVKVEAVPSSDAGGPERKRSGPRGNRYLPEVVVTRPPNAPTKQGSSGQLVKLSTNYFRLTRNSDKTIFQYCVEFVPAVEDVRQRYALIRAQGALFGPQIFDGATLFLYNKLKRDELTMEAKDARSGVQCQLHIRLVGSADMSSEKGLMVLNLLQRKAMRSLELLQLGRHFFDPLAKIAVPQFGLEIYPGYITSVRQHEQEVMMCVEITHRVMRRDTCYQLMSSVQRQPGPFRENFHRAIVGAIVMSTYNQKTYRIVDVDFSTTPSSSFTKADGTSITFMEYFQTRYNVRIRDPQQPMLVTAPSARQKRQGCNNLLLLVPELSRMTGITEEMRKDFHLMRSIADQTRLRPDKRLERLAAFNQRLQNTPATREVFGFWKTELDRRLLEVPGRILEQELIVFGQDRPGIAAGRKAEWNQAFRNNHMQSSVELRRWAVLVEGSGSHAAYDFVRLMMDVGNGMGFRISEPHYYYVRGNSLGSYTEAVTEAAMKDVQLITIIVPNDRADRYSAIKKQSCLQYGIPTQVLKQRTITPRGGNVRSLMSVATKVAVQLNCKLGGIPWTVKNPLQSVMVIGFDVCTKGTDKSKTSAALVATMYAPGSKQPSYFSVVEQRNKGEVLSDAISINVLKALRTYEHRYGAGQFPRRIILYRAGVGDGQLANVVEHELLAIKQNLDMACAKREKPVQLTVIVVTKRVNTRLFLGRDNPPPGTVVDDKITLPERTDFFLVSQSVMQGSVSPTAYNVIYDESGLTIDQLQVYTYKQTHLYYNWSGTLAVPAVCQYAQKLAHLTANSLHQQSDGKLDHLLYYL